MGLALTARAERPLKERVSLEGSARKFWQFEINPGILGPVSDQKWHFSHPFADLTSKKLFVNIRLRLERQQKNFLKSTSNLVISFLFIWNWNVINTFIRRRFRENLACENIRFSSLFAAGDVSRGGTSATQWQKFHTDVCYAGDRSLPNWILTRKIAGCIQKWERWRIPNFLGFAVL